MKPLKQRIDERAVSPGSLACWWLGGSGFVFKTSPGTICYIDPYLSDSVLKIFDLGRGFPAPIEPHDVRADVVISTHWHEDHLDPGTIPVIAQRNPAVTFIMPPSAMAHALHWGVAPRKSIQPLTSGQRLAVKDVTIQHTPARHDPGIAGWEAPDAMGVVLRAEGMSVYNTGDTEYDARLRLLKRERPDAAMLCINGVTGNMNAHEAALLAWQLGSRVVVPMHHLLWAGNPAGTEATLDPTLFAETYRRLGGSGRVVLPEVGQEVPLA